MPLVELMVSPSVYICKAISHEGIVYYASLVSYYTATRLNDLDSWMVYVYLLCFLHHRYHRLHDHLLSGFMQAVKAYRDEATAAAQTQAAAYRVSVTEDLVRAGQVLQIFTDDQIPPELPFAMVQARAFSLLDRDRLQDTATYMATGVGCDETAFFWQAIDTMARRFKGRLRPLLGGVTLTANRADSPLLLAITFLQDLFTRGRTLTQVDSQMIPTVCIPVRLKRYLYRRTTDGAPQLLVDRYEFMIYQLVRAALEAGDVCCAQSVRFRSIEDDLIPAAEWKKHKAAYLAETQRPIFQQPITEHLAALEQELEAQFADVNGRIAVGKNSPVQITQHGATRRWTLQTPTLRDGVNHAVFERLPQVALNDVLAFVAERSHIEAGRGWAVKHAGTAEDDQQIVDYATATLDIGRLRYDARRERLPQWECALAAALRLRDQHAEALALLNLGQAYIDLGQTWQAILKYEQALTIARILGDRRREGLILNHLGDAFMTLGEAQRAIPFFEQYLVIAQKIGDRSGEGIVLGNLGATYGILGEVRHAICYYEQALTIYRELGHRHREAVILCNLGTAYQELGKVRRGVAAFEQALVIAHTLGDRQCESVILGGLGNAYTDLNEAECAIECCELSLAIARERGDRRTEGYTLSYLARAQAQQGDLAHATTTFEEALALFHKVGARHGEAECNWQFGLALAQQEEHERALSLLRAALAYEQEVGHVKAAEHAALVARLEVGEELAAELLRPAGQR